MTICNSADRRQAHKLGAAGSVQNFFLGLNVFLSAFGGHGMSLCAQLPLACLPILAMLS